MIRIELSGVRELQARIAQYPQAAETALQRTGAELFARIHARADAHTKTGALIKSLDQRYVPGSYTIFHDPQKAPHARFVHWGTKPHIIRPKDKKALRWPAGGAFAFFAKEVHHPGNAADPYFLTETTDVHDLFSRFLNQAIKEI